MGGSSHEGGGAVPTATTVFWSEPARSCVSESSPISPSLFFDTSAEVATKRGTFFARFRGRRPPLFDAAATTTRREHAAFSLTPDSKTTDAPLAERRARRDTGGSRAGNKHANDVPDCFFVFVHGAGQNSTSFATCVGAMFDAAGDAARIGCVCYDQRGHGLTADDPYGKGTGSGNSSGNGSGSGSGRSPPDCSLENMRDDLLAVLDALFDKDAQVVLVGHSMGGPVVVSAAGAAARGGSAVSARALVVIDVVEGVAMASLGAMRSLLLSRPTGFDSPSEAVVEAVSSGTSRNATSARVSVPGTLVANHDDPSAAGGEAWQRRTDLLATEPFWRGWFTGLSSSFLEVKVPKLLILAGAERLDVELMTAQMQGKFQLQILGDVGHAVHEDAPGKTAGALMSFSRRHGLLPHPPSHTHAPHAPHAPWHPPSAQINHHEHRAFHLRDPAGAIHPATAHLRTAQQPPFLQSHFPGGGFDPAVAPAVAPGSAATGFITTASHDPSTRASVNAAASPPPPIAAEKKHGEA